MASTRARLRFLSPLPLASLAAVAFAAFAAGVGLPASGCSSGVTADCSDSQCGVVPEGSTEISEGGDESADSPDDTTDASQPIPEAGGADQEASTPLEGGAADADAGDVHDAGDSGSHDGGDSGSKDAAEGG